MNELIDCISSIFWLLVQCFLMLTLWELFCCLRHWRTASKPIAWVPPTQCTTSSSGPTVVTSLATFAAPEPAQQAPEPVAAPPAPQPQVLMEAAEDVIECGSCHQDIRSKPVTTMQVDGGSWHVYVCEHCGTQVKLPA